VLSGGEQQRVAIARAIVGEPAILLCDEPTGNLDPLLAIDILGLFEDIHEAGTTVLFATHDRTLLEVRPRRVVVLDDGKAMDVQAGLAAPAAMTPPPHPSASSSLPRPWAGEEPLHEDAFDGLDLYEPSHAGAE
jgi:cell division transport system ATP-binding protein